MYITTRPHILWQHKRGDFNVFIKKTSLRSEGKSVIVIIKETFHSRDNNDSNNERFVDAGKKQR